MIPTNLTTPLLKQFCSQHAKFVITTATSIISLYLLDEGPSRLAKWIADHIDCSLALRLRLRIWHAWVRFRFVVDILKKTSVE